MAALNIGTNWKKNEIQIFFVVDQFKFWFLEYYDLIGQKIKSLVK